VKPQRRVYENLGRNPLLQCDCQAESLSQFQTLNIAARQHILVVEVEMQQHFDSLDNEPFKKLGDGLNGS